MTIRTLIVDDDFRVARIHAEIVSTVAGFSVTQTVGSVAAAGRIPGSAVDLLLVDLYLPDGDGRDLARRIGCDFMVLSASAEPETVSVSLARGALGYIIKPFDPAVLRGRLEAYRRFRGALDRTGVLVQADIDRAFQILHGAPSGSTRAKGHSAPTETAVERAVADAGGPVSASEVAELVGISRATANRYLSHLADLGRIEMQLRYGATGRPEHRFVAADTA
ncbi:response regulator [Millisia brevis]|uniref:response regulator n=1 Tax=Millisia brevis TaxID=264148 RepID=UPI00082C35B3|nr:response regulator [Millisia brevis]